MAPSKVESGQRKGSGYLKKIGSCAANLESVKLLISRVYSRFDVSSSIVTVLTSGISWIIFALGNLLCLKTRHFAKSYWPKPNFMKLKESLKRYLQSPFRILLSCHRINGELWWTGWLVATGASRNGWAASNFHSCCDNEGPTLTVIKSGEYIFGGYAGQEWKSKNFGL